MKQSLLRAPKAGNPLRGKMKISSNTDNFSAASSNSVTAAAGDVDEVESNYSIVSLENSDQSRLPEFPPASLLEPVGAARENLKEASTSVEPASLIEDIVRGGRNCADEILTESSEVAAQPEPHIIMINCSAKDEGEWNLELALAGFSKAMENLSNAIREVLLPDIEQRKRQRRNDGVLFSLVRVGELTLAFFIGAVLVSFLLTAVAPEGYLISNNFSEFNGPAPT